MTTITSPEKGRKEGQHAMKTPPIVSPQEWEAVRERMGEVFKFIPPDTVFFEPETVAVLGAAFDKTIAAIHNGRQPEPVREAIAECIIALAAKGERNPDRMCEATLTAMGILR